jgi:hypothetical protein
MDPVRVRPLTQHVWQRSACVPGLNTGNLFAPPPSAVRDTWPAETGYAPEALRPSGPLPDAADQDRRGEP